MLFVLESLSNLENEFYAIKSGSSGSPGNQSAIANMDMNIVDNKVIITSDDPLSGTHDPAKGIQGTHNLSGSPAELTVKYDNPEGGINIQTGANSGDNLEVNIPGITVSSLGLNQINVSNHSVASASIDTLDNAIEKVSELRSNLGSYQNRLDHTINNLSNYEANIEASNSRIEDVDIAKEMVNMSKQQILSQAGTAMLAQANNLPQGVLQLIS
jgi:flagellin